MANKNMANSINSKCTVCGKNFKHVGECLKHELIEHSLKKKTNRQSSVQKRINAVAKTLNNDDNLYERTKLKKQLNNCKNGEELHKILELYCIKPDILGLIFTRIQTCIERELSSAGVVMIYPFGSIASGLALRDCDIDIYLDPSNIEISPTQKRCIQKGDRDTQRRFAFNRINNLLHRSPHFSQVLPIRSARVPIIKCTHKDTGFSIDLNMSCPESQANTQFTFELVRSDERIHELMLFLKLWGKSTQIIALGNMSSYCLITMVIFFLQQPWKSGKEENGDKNCRILKSLKELQKDCEFHMVHGVNYAFNLKCIENQPKIPTGVTTWDLIKEFYNFYKDFNFEDHIISPFYGKSIKRTNLTPDICEEYYKQLRTKTQYLMGEKPIELKTDCCMCVQDTFSLNQNIAKSIVPHGKQYFILCLQNAYRICENSNKFKLGELYEQLLFETIKTNDIFSEGNKKNNSQVTTDLKNVTSNTTDLKNVTLNTTDVPAPAVKNNKGNFVYTLIPSKEDIRKLALHYTDLPGGQSIFRCWCQHYVNFIETILVQIYRMDIQKHAPTQQKQQKIDKNDKDKQLDQSWIISCTVDLWTNRCFQKYSNTSFMKYQVEQTIRLHNLRRQDPKFSVSMNVVLKLNTLPNYKGMEIQFDFPDGSVITSLGKKSPLRKFFNIFKNTLQSFNIKEILNIDAPTSKNTKQNIKQPPEATSSLVATPKPWSDKL